MGDRVSFVFHGGKYHRIAPAVYSHWAGHDAPELLKEAADLGLIRRNDPGYSAARMCGYLHEHDPRSTTGLGLQTAPKDLAPETLKEFSPGDGGVIVVNVGDGSDYDLEFGEVSYHAGYHARTLANEPGYGPEEGEEPREYPTTIRLSE